jgi:hypothetical protein
VSNQQTASGNFGCNADGSLWQYLNLKNAETLAAR